LPLFYEAGFFHELYLINKSLLEKFMAVLVESTEEDKGTGKNKNMVALK
jgi:hypothetical protein